MIAAWIGGRINHIRRILSRWFCCGVPVLHIHVKSAIFRLWMKNEINQHLKRHTLIEVSGRLKCKRTTNQKLYYIHPYRHRPRQNFSKQKIRIKSQCEKFNYSGLENKTPNKNIFKLFWSFHANWDPVSVWNKQKNTHFYWNKHSGIEERQINNKKTRSQNVCKLKFAINQNPKYAIIVTRSKSEFICLNVKGAIFCGFSFGAIVIIVVFGE